MKALGEQSAERERDQRIILYGNNNIIRGNLVGTDGKGKGNGELLWNLHFGMVKIP